MVGEDPFFHRDQVGTEETPGVLEGLQNEKQHPHVGLLELQAAQVSYVEVQASTELRMPLILSVRFTVRWDTNLSRILSPEFLDGVFVSVPTHYLYLGLHGDCG